MENPGKRFGRPAWFGKTPDLVWEIRECGLERLVWQDPGGWFGKTRGLVWEDPIGLARLVWKDPGGWFGKTRLVWEDPGGWFGRIRLVWEGPGFGLEDPVVWFRNI